MAVTREQLVNAGASEDLAQLLASELRRRDWTWNPMAVAVVVAFLGLQAWLVVSVMELRTDVVRDIAVLQKGQERLAADIAVLKVGQERLAADIAGTKASIAVISQAPRSQP